MNPTKFHHFTGKKINFITKDKEMMEGGFMKSIEELYHWIGSGGLRSVQHEFHDIDWGDEYLNGSGNEYKIWLNDYTVSIGYEYITEDDDNWAQAECYIEWHCMDITDPDSEKYFRTIDFNEVYKKCLKEDK